MKQYQPIHAAGIKRPGGFFAKYRDIVAAGRPRHYTLRRRHQPDHTARIFKIGSKQRNGESIADDGLALRVRPQRCHLIPDRALGDSAKLRPVIKIPQVQNIDVHCVYVRLWAKLPTYNKCNQNRKAMPLEIVTIPCLSDNYAYLAHDEATGATAVVDVPEAAPILNALAEREWRASHILITHHHNDHTAGVGALAAATGARVIGAKADRHRLPRLDEAVSPGDAVRIGMYSGEVIDVSGHTVGHVAFHFPEAAAVFTADSLMALGCGRLFEGTPEMMWNSLSRLAALPPGTLVCSGHEYAQSNARFALTIEPENPALISRANAIAEARKDGRPTVPTEISLERATNPFLRASMPEVKKLIGMPDATDVAVFAEIRARKDRF